MFLRLFWLSLALLATLWGHLFAGVVEFSTNDVLAYLAGENGVEPSLALILSEIRIPRILTAVLAGASLACAGLMMQTFFKNPLAGPFELGVSSGASLGVAIALWIQHSTGQIGSHSTLVLPACVGAFLSLGLVLFLSRYLHQKVALLILGIMLGYLSSGLVGMLLTLSDADTLKQYVLWSFGTFSGVSRQDLPLFASSCLLPLIPGFLLARQLNLSLLGDAEAQLMGLSLSRLKWMLILISSVIAAAVTAYCGPIAFLGLAAPHAARMLFQTADHRLLLPASMLIGSVMALFSDYLALKLAVGSLLPLNAVLSVLGAPYVIFILLRSEGMTQSC